MLSTRPAWWWLCAAVGVSAPDRMGADEDKGQAGSCNVVHVGRYGQYASSEATSGSTWAPDGMARPGACET